MRDKFERFHRVKYNILNRQPFLGEVLLALRFGLAPCQTCYTDMKNIVFDPDFMDTLQDIELEICILHELYHCILHHCTRARGKIVKLYNIACDIVVNSFIYQEYHRSFVGDIELLHIYKGIEGSEYSAEEIYYDLLKYAKTNSSLSEMLDFNGGLLSDHKEWSNINENEDNIDYMIKEAMKKHSNELPSCFRRVLEGQLDRQIDWRLVLRDYLKILYYDEDYSFKKRDTRYFDAPYIMPGLINQESVEQLTDALIAVDVSGSVTDKEYFKFINEIKHLQHVLHFKAHITFFNTNATPPELLTNNTEYNFGLVKGYGGTSYSSVFKLLEEKSYRVVIIFTDGCCNFPPQPSTPVIWIVLGSASVPYGKYIEMN